MLQYLPVEMKLAIVDLLDGPELKSLSLINQVTRALTVPAIFRVRAVHSLIIFSLV